MQSRARRLPRKQAGHTRACCTVAAILCAQGAAAGTSISNTTQGTVHTTIQAAIDAASPGDTIELAEGIYFEDAIVIPIAINLRGDGPKLTTIIATEANSQPTLTLDDLPAAASISGFSIASAFATGATASALFVFAGEPHIFDLTIEGCNGGQASVITESSDAIFQRITVRNSSGFLSAFEHRGAGSPAIINSLFVDNTAPSAVLVFNTQARFINCTFDGNPQDFQTFSSGSVLAINSIFTVPNTEPSVQFVRCLGPGLDPAGGNTDAAPAFIDQAAGNYRLVASSLAVDAGDLAVYLDAGGEVIDAEGNLRFNDDPGRTNTGVGPLATLDLGAFEYQPGTPPVPCAGDVNRDGTLTPADFTAWLKIFNNPGSSPGCD